MENEILIALISKMVEDRVVDLPPGSRGPRGHAGLNGKDFVFSEHEETIRAWAKEFAIKFKDLSDDEIESLRGPRGRDGRDGADGSSFVFAENREQIDSIIRIAVADVRDDLRLKFTDLTEEEVAAIRGPRGRDGRDGKDGKGFEFEEHKAYFETLKLKFADLTAEEKSELTLRFSHLSDEDREQLKLKFADLTEEDRLSLRGPRGLRGQRGSHGRDGKDGRNGIRGLPGPQGLRGLPGRDAADGRDGRDGSDAPYITAIEIDPYGKDEFVFVFVFSDGNEIRTERLKLPTPVNYFSGGGGGGGKVKVDYETIVDEADADTTYVGYALPGYATSDAKWKIKRIQVTGTETIIEYADSNALFDNVFDDRASLSYG